MAVDLDQSLSTVVEHEITDTHHSINHATELATAGRTGRRNWCRRRSLMADVFDLAFK